jgi:nicotinate-nucleotide--dimethylbenzimidazole phosphoribosyltransferase
VVQTSYLPATSSCSTCAQTSPTAVITTSYAPSTVYRPVEVQPVVDTVVASPCSCPAEAPCSSCPTCPTSVSQAVYADGATTTSGCATCAESGSGPSYTFGTESAAQSSTTQGSTTQGTSSGLEQPRLPPDEAEPSTANFGAPPAGSTGAGGSPNGAQESTGGAAPSPLPDDGAASEPGTGAESKPSDTSTFYEFPEAPPLMGPQNDRTAHRPTVEVHNAVYRRPVRNANVSTTVAKPATSSSQTSAGNGGGWYSISER